MNGFIFGFMNNFIAGVIASFVTVVLIEFAKRNHLSRTFKVLEGLYSHVDLDDQPVLNGITEIKYLGGTLLALNGHKGKGEWVGLLRMDKTIANYGSGTYEYLDRRDCGILHVHFSKRDQSFFIHGMNTSHGEERVFAYRWKRI